MFARPGHATVADMTDARLIRLQIETARLPDDTEPPAVLQVEEEQLLEACEKALPWLEGITFGGFERGLVGSVHAATPAAFRRHALPRVEKLEREFSYMRLPSTSPAHAGRTFAQKLAAWRAVSRALRK